MVEQFQQMDLAGKLQPTKMYGFQKFLPHCDDILMFFLFTSTHTGQDE